ncbi:unnamed protein product [Caenorhabditis brenneri]
MFCSSESAIDGMDSDRGDVRRLKDGDILKYTSGFFSSKWKKVYAVLFSDSRLVWFEEKGDRKPKGSVLLKDVMPYICVGLMTDRMPVKRPNVPSEHSVHHLVGIGMNPKADPCHWLLFSSDSDIESWFTEIMKTLPKPDNPPLAPPPQGPSPQGPPPQDNQKGLMGPPQQYNAGPPQNYPAGPQAQPPPAYPYPTQGPPVYNNQGATSSHTTVVVQNQGGGGYDNGADALLVGAALGMGTGMMAGNLMGYGLGSMWGGHGMMMGGGFGGGYYSDNDTNVTNNYYNYGDGGGGEAGAGASASAPPEPPQAEIDYGNTDYGGGGGGYDAYDYGGGYDAGDFGGGDYGGGDF